MRARTKKIKQFFKTYLYFSQGERKGILVLGFVLVALMCLPAVFRYFTPMPDITMRHLPVVQTAVDVSDSTVSSSLFSFNPNTASQQELVALGFSVKQAQTIQHYRAKGGTFKSPSDLDKLYGVSPDLIRKLKPYVVIPAMAQKHKRDSVYPRNEKQAIDPVELNSADSLTIVKLYRIGPALTHRLLEYRNKLGGFVNLHQLTEIYGFDEDILYDLDGKIMVDASKARIWEVNTVTVEELKTHPYFKYKLSNAIVNYRLQHGPYQQLSDLRKIVIVNDSIYRNIVLYLKVN